MACSDLCNLFVFRACMWKLLSISNYKFLSTVLFLLYLSFTQKQRQVELLLVSTNTSKMTKEKDQQIYFWFSFRSVYFTFRLPKKREANNYKINIYWNRMIWRAFDVFTAKHICFFSLQKFQVCVCKQTYNYKLEQMSANEKPFFSGICENGCWMRSEHLLFNACKRSFI